MGRGCVQFAAVFLLATGPVPGACAQSWPPSSAAPFASAPYVQGPATAASADLIRYELFPITYGYGLPQPQRAREYGPAPPQDPAVTTDAWRSSYPYPVAVLPGGRPDVGAPPYASGGGGGSPDPIRVASERPGAAAWQSPPPTFAEGTGGDASQTLPFVSLGEAPASPSPPKESPTPQPSPKQSPSDLKSAPPDGRVDAECVSESCAPWALRIDLVGMRCREPNSELLIADPSGCAVIDGKDLEFSHSLGVHAALVHQAGCGRSWELAYWGIPQWDANASAVGALELKGPGFSLGVNPGVFTVGYDACLHTVEANLRTDYTGTHAWLVGFRYFYVADELRISELNSPFPGVLQVATSNNLYGMQFGSESLLYHTGGPLSAAMIVKVGILANDAQQHTRSSILGPAIGDGSVRLALSGEAALRLTYALTDCVQLVGTYQMLGLAGVAAAPNQLRNTDLTAGRAAVHFSSLIFDGGTIGVVLSW